MARQAHLSTSLLMETAITAVRNTHSSISKILELLATDPDQVAHEFARLQRVTGTDSRKGMLALDQYAESQCRVKFLEQFPTDLQFVGEESLSSFSSWGSHRYCVLVDMVDGTDLLEMGANLWCSAVIIFDRVDKKIIGSVVGLPSGQVFHAQDGEDSANIRIGERDFPVSGCSKVMALCDARICFYGQKLDRMFAVSDNGALRSWFENLDGRARDIMRIYNFGGNPMLVRLVNRPKDSDNAALTGDVDAVFELAGQQIHDMAAGAYIAKRAGAFLCDLNAQEIDLEHLASMLEFPKKRVPYIMASTQQLAFELAGLLGDKSAVA